MLPGRTAAEVGTAHDDVARLHGLGKVRVDILHTVGGQGFGIGIVQMAGRNDHVGIHVVAIFKDLHG